MIYLRKIFESIDNQKEDIESVFSDFLDETYKAFDGESYPVCEIEDSDSRYMSVSIYKDTSVNNVVNNISEFDDMLNSKNKELEFLKKVKTCLIRLNYLKYKWAMNNEEDSSEFYISVYYKDIKLCLADAFGGEEQMRNINENVMKEVFKEAYNLTYLSYTHQPGRSGYYGSKAVLYIQIKESIDIENRLIKDLKSAIHRYKAFTTHAEGEKWYEERAFYSVSLIHGGRTIKIECRS